MPASDDGKSNILVEDHASAQPIPFRLLVYYKISPKTTRSHNGCVSSEREKNK